MNDMAFEASVRVIPVEAIRPDPENIRKVQPTRDEDVAFFKSVAEVGVRIPIIVRPDLEGANSQYVIVAGERRWRASKEAGLAVVPAIVREYEGGQASVDQVVENAIRTDMHPVDQWRSIDKLMRAGYSLSTAEAMIGLSERAAGRIKKLSTIHPDILAAFSKHEEMPDWEELSIIARAPLDVQAEAFKRFNPDEGEWWPVIQSCSIDRIPRSRAIFDIETSGVVFEEDLFGEPTDENRFTTEDIAGFMAAQAKALAQQEKESKGRIMVLAGSPAMNPIPAGWQRVWSEIPKRWKKEDKRCVAKWITRQGYDIGAIGEALLEPRPVRDGEAAPAGPVRSDDDRPRQADETTPSPREPITKAGQDILSLAKREAVRGALAALDRRGAKLEGLLQLVLLAVTASNVVIHGDPQNHWSRASFGDVAAKLVGQDGMLLDLSREQLVDLVGEVVGRLVVFESPRATTNSGPVAEWIGAALKADGYMPSMDNADFLATCNADMLRQAAAYVKIEKPAKTAKALKEQLAGHAPGWHPARFGAPGPNPLADEPDDYTDEAPPPPDFDDVEAPEC